MAPVVACVYRHHPGQEARGAPRHEARPRDRREERQDGSRGSGSSTGYRSPARQDNQAISSSKGARVRFSDSDLTRTVIDGPFAGAKELIAGFWIFQVKSKEVGEALSESTSTVTASAAKVNSHRFADLRPWHRSADSKCRHYGKVAVEASERSEQRSDPMEYRYCLWVCPLLGLTCQATSRLRGHSARNAGLTPASRRAAEQARGRQAALSRRPGWRNGVLSRNDVARSGLC